MTITSDHSLLQLVQAGDQSALMLLYGRYSSLVYSIAFRVLKNPTSSEDVTQELFMQLWNRPEQIRVVGETLHGWMMIAARNRSIDILRKKTPEYLGDFVLASPSNLGKLTEERLMCETVLTLLAAPERTLIEMAFLQEMTHAEIASATGWPLGTIKSRIRRALCAVRTVLAASSVELLATAL